MKLDIIFHYEVDEQTGEMKFIGKNEITVDTKKTVSKSSSSKIDSNPEPIITLTDNKLSSYGDTFKLESTDKVGIFKMIGNKNHNELEVPEELVNITEELNSLDDLGKFTL